MKSEWIQFVENLAKERGIKYNEALKIASPLYHKQRGTKPPAKKPKSSGGKKKHSTKDVVNSVHQSLKNGLIHNKSSKKDIKNALASKKGGCLELFGIPLVACNPSDNEE